jgi:predicted nucleic acid-binding protein
MPRFTALVDASALYSMTVTDLVIETAQSGIFRARWSEDIHAEWMERLKAKRPDLDPAKIEARRRAMDAAMPDCLVQNYRDLIDGLALPDLDDRHVLAAAIAGHADVIVTYNLRDFPEDVLAPYGIEAQHPDTFLIHQRGLGEHVFLECVRRCRRRLQSPEFTPDEYLNALRKVELVLIAAELEKIKSLL